MIPSIAVYIASGGASRRFGSEKARALLPDGRTLIEHAAARLRPLAASLTVVADSPDKYADLGLRTIADLHPGRGPLAGLQAALLDANNPSWILYTSCDFLGFDPRWLEKLWNARRPETTAVVFRSPPTTDTEFPHWQPMFALYHTQTLEAIRTALDENRLTFWRFLETISARPVAAPDDWEKAISINTPTDLQCYLRANHTHPT